MAAPDYPVLPTFICNDAVPLRMVAKVGELSFVFHMDHFKSFNATSGGNGIVKLYYQLPGYFKLQQTVIIKNFGLVALQIELVPLEGVVCGDGEVFKGVTPIFIVGPDRQNLELKLQQIQIDLADDQAVVFTIPQ